MNDRELADYLEKVKFDGAAGRPRHRGLQGTLTLGPKTLEALQRAARPYPTTYRRQADPPGGEAGADLRRLAPRSRLRSSPEAREYAPELQQTASGLHLHAGDAPVRRAGARHQVRRPRRAAPPRGRPDTLTIQLSYFEQKEDYKLILVNNTVTTQDYQTLGGATSTGDFGSMMREIFEPGTEAHFEWDHWGTLRGRRVMAFAYHVAQARSQWHIVYDRMDIVVPAYSRAGGSGQEYPRSDANHAAAARHSGRISGEKGRHRPGLRLPGHLGPHLPAAAEGPTIMGRPTTTDAQRRGVPHLPQVLGLRRHHLRYGADTTPPPPLPDDKTNETKDPKVIKK